MLLDWDAYKIEVKIKNTKLNKIFKKSKNVTLIILLFIFVWFYPFFMPARG